MAENERDSEGEERQNQAGADGAGGTVDSLRSSLMTKEVVIPALATAATVVAYAARKGANEAQGKLEGEAHKLGEKGAKGASSGLTGGVGKALGGVASKALPGGGGGKA